MQLIFTCKRNIDLKTKSILNFSKYFQFLKKENKIVNFMKNYVSKSVTPSKTKTKKKLT